MSVNMNLTGKPSIDKPWLKYYPPILMDHLQVPTCTLTQYLQHNMPSLDTPAIHYYGSNITWGLVFSRAERIAKSLKVLGIGVGDQIPVFLRAVPEFISLLLAAERIGASILCRDNEVYENAQAMKDANAKILFTHSFLPQVALDEYHSTTDVSTFVLMDPCNSCKYRDMPEYVQKSLDGLYNHKCAGGENTMTWHEFLALGDNYDGEIDAPADIDRPLYRCYTSGSTGASKQVIHSAHTIIGVLSQMNFYGGKEPRSTWLHTILPPALVAVVVSMMLLPLASNKLLILDPWVDVKDIDLELMRYKPNNWPMIPMFIEVLMNSKRIPADYDISHLVAMGAGAEACNNTQIKRIHKFLTDHNSKIAFTTGYGSSEAGSNLTFHVSGRPAGMCNVGCPMPLTTVSIFKPGTTEELSYNQSGEICVTGPGVMLGYDNIEATEKVLIRHEDGQLWLHMGDIGHIDSQGHIYTAGRGSNRRYGGGFLDILPMENRIADADIPGIVDQFFVIIPDAEHEGFQIPYWYVVLEDGYTIDSIRGAVYAALEPHMIPVEIIQLPERPFWHFKTNRIGLTNKVLNERRRAMH